MPESGTSGSVRDRDGQPPGLLDLHFTGEAYWGVDQQYPPGYCWSTLRIVLDDLKSAQPHLYCRPSGSRVCGMPLMKSFYIFLLPK